MDNQTLRTAFRKVARSVLNSRGAHVPGEHVLIAAHILGILHFRPVLITLLASSGLQYLF